MGLVKAVEVEVGSSMLGHIKQSSALREIAVFSAR